MTHNDLHTSIAYKLATFDYLDLSGEQRAVGKIFAELAFRVADQPALSPSVANALAALTEARTLVLRAFNAPENSTSDRDTDICKAMLDDLAK